MTRQQKRKNQRNTKLKEIEKAFSESFKVMDEGGRARTPTATSTPIIDKIMYYEREKKRGKK